MKCTTDIRSTAGWVVFGLAIFLPAFLIFLIQPMVGKRILPWFGGTPAVWAVCLAFYQTALFVGYAYAHFLIRFVPPRFQLFIHAGVVAAAILTRPVLPDVSWAIQDHSGPIQGILAMLSVHVALPFVVLASSGPLVQSWFATRYPDRSPYPLYSVSNFGSFLALVAFPFWIEPRFGLVETGETWSWTFIGAVLLVLVSASMARRANARFQSDTETLPTKSKSEGPDAKRVALWILLPAAAVLMLNGLTNRLCLDIASIPFLWILPLGTYLLTFVINFSSESAYRRVPYFALVFGLLAISAVRSAAFALDGRSSAGDLSLAFGSIQMGIAYFCTLLFALCSILHGELYRLRPGPEKLTAFYLCVSGGGALGGLFVGIAAPSLFDGYFEFVIGLFLSIGLGGYCIARDFGGLRSGWRASPLALKATICVGLFLIVFESFQTSRPMNGQVHQERNFFGVLRILEDDTQDFRSRYLMHGTTLHGTQIVKPESAAKWPTAYFGQASPLSTLMRIRPRDRGARVGIVGLGIGTISSYGRHGDSIRFYEIDPTVIQIASDESRFTFLSTSAADIEIRTGDARLLLEEEQRRGEKQEFDFLIVDAFSSDSIPVHLLTSEAFKVYAASLIEDGVVAVHISNRHFDLAPFIARAGQETGLVHLVAKNSHIRARKTVQSNWIFLTKSTSTIERIQRSSKALLRRLSLPPETQWFEIFPPRQLDQVPLWTDDYSDLFSALRERRKRS